VWWQELIDGYASNAAMISTNRRAVSSPRSIPIAVLPRRSRSGRPSGRLSETGYRGSRGQGDQRGTVEAGVVEPVQQMNRAGPRGTDRKFADLYGSFSVKWLFGLLPVFCSERKGRFSSRRLQSGPRSARKGSRDRNASAA